MNDAERFRQEAIKESKDQVPVEKKDVLAMWLSGMLVVGVPCLLMILLIVGVTMLLFGR